MTDNGTQKREGDVALAFEPHAQTGPWLVLRTRARQEKAVARYLQAQGVHHYLPLISRVSVSGSRKFRSEVPLFPGYVFLNGPAESAYGAVTNKRVCQILPVPDQQQLIDELVQIHRAIGAEIQLELYPFAVIGQRCRIRAGTLKGVEGTLIDRPSRDRFVLQVNMIGQGASLEIDADLLEPIETA